MTERRLDGSETEQERKIKGNQNKRTRVKQTAGKKADEKVWKLKEVKTHEDKTMWGEEKVAAVIDFLDTALAVAYCTFWESLTT